MIEIGTDAGLAAQLMRVARDPALRGTLYDRIGDYCHNSRNLLNSLKLSLYLVKQQDPAHFSDSWSDLDSHYRELERKIEHVQRLCRPLTLSRIRIGLELLIEDRRPAWSDLWSTRHDPLEFRSPPGPVIATFDADRLGHALDAVVAWRAGRESDDVAASLAWWSEAGEIRLAWQETSGSELGPPIPDPGWSLPWLTRVVAEHGGVTEVREDDQGWRLDIRWLSGPPAP